MDHSPLQRSPFAGSPFSGIFLAWCVAAVVLSIFFFSYFHRAFASLLSLAIRSYTWKAHGIYIDLRALQVSLLGGRIFFTGLRYHGNNETIFIQNGYITWSYWQWRVRQSDIDRSKVAAQDQAAGKDDKNARLPCRVNVVLNGLEWFVYNRSAAYDSVLAGIVQDTEETPLTPVAKEEEHAKLRRRADRAPYGSPGDTSPRKSTSQRGTSGDNSSWNGHGRPKMTFQTAGSDEDNAASQGKSGSDDELPFLLQFFPIHLRCTKAAVVMGNENTKAIMIINSKGLTGEIDASATETQDPYRQTYKIKLESPVIEFRDNQDYKEDQVDKAVREREVAKQSAPLQRRSIFRRYRRKALSRMRDLVPFWRSTVESLSLEGEDAPVAAAERKPPGSNHWQGLSRYLDDLERNEQLRWAGVEYAAENTILDTPEATITMYWDTPGLVAPRRPGTVEKATAPENVNNINGDDPPAWGINVSIKGGSINYGPWADRHRAELQRVFFPGLCKDSQPAQRLPVGASRVPTQLKVYVELDDDVTLRVPMREESKNWRFRGKEPTIRADKERDRRRTRNRLKQSDQGTAGAFDRQYGWLDVKLAANATVSYCMDMAAGNQGFSSSLDLDFPKTEITSSINHELLWRSGKQRISCDLSTPLKWNALRQWRFDITTDALELFILRDHVFLLTDLINDWSSGPPAEYLVFTPFKYFIDLHFPNVKLYLNVNDGNIINKPTDPEDNAYIIITSPLLEASTCISLDKFRPAKSMIPFDVRTDEASIDLHVPPWNTQASFVKSMAIGHLETIVIDGGYHYNAATAPALTDTLILNVNGQSPVVHLFGFVIRYFLKVKDNYFGDDVHFKTLEEYQEMLELKEKNPEAEAQTKPPPKKSNGMDVILSVRVDDPKIFLPANLYSSERNVQIDGTTLTADMRFTNYYMDLDLVFSPLHLSLAHGDNGADTPISATTTTQLFIDGISVYGHRVFGLPPTEPTYLCNWDLSVGAVSGECTAEFLTALMRGGKAFGLSFDDDENALISNASIVMYDVTFLRVFVQSVRLWLHVDEAAFLFSTGSIDVNYNDWARSHYSKRSNITIPDIQLSCVNAESASRQRSRSHDAVETDLMVRTSVNLATIARKCDFTNQRQAQQELVRREDQRTFRTPFLVLPGILQEHAPDVVDPPVQPVPPVPQPTLAADVPYDKASLSSSSASGRSRSLRHKASFLSISSSSQDSIIRPNSSRLSSRHSKLPEGLRSFTPMNQQQPGHPHRRDPSASTGRHSAFYSAHGDLGGDKRDQIHNTVAFSSQYFAPYFPLETVQPDTTETLVSSIEEDETGSSHTEFDLGDVDPANMAEDHAYSSIMIELPTGLTAFMNPTALKNVAALISALQPSDPEDILDTLQVNAMSSISAKQNMQKMKGTFSDVHLRIPRANLRFVNASEMDSSEPPKEEQDQYDFHIGDLALMTRSQTSWKDPFDASSVQKKDSFHVRLGNLEVAAAERLASHYDTHAAAMAQIENVMISMGSKDLTYLDGDVGSIRSSLSSEKIEYLAALIHRTTALATDLESVFSPTLAREAKLTRYLAYKIVTQAHDAIDPTFLNRPSAVLRSAKQHLRTYDSWKLIARLRQMWATLDPSSKDQLRLNCYGSTFDYPADARQYVVNAFERWRSWDLHDTQHADLITDVFGKNANDQPATPSADLAFLAVVRLRDTQIVLDPGPKQNEISFTDITARFQDKNPPGPYDTPESGSEAASMTMLNVYCGEAAIRLNWDLCELVDDALRLYMRLQDRKEDRPPAQEKPSTKALGNSLHVIVAVGHGEVALDAINLNSVSLVSGLKASLLVRNDSKDVSDTDFILSCEAVTSRMRSHTQVLGVFQLREPAIVASHTLHKTETTDSHTIKASANSKQLSFAVQQDPLGLLEVLDLLIKDEAAQLNRLKSHLPSSVSSPKPKKPDVRIKDRLSSFRVNIAMFLDEYNISVPLLQSLTYCISGVVSRAAMAANFGKEIIFDFDIKENCHEIQVKVNEKLRSLSLLQIPPINGRIKSIMGQEETKMHTFASVELIQLDASAVYSLLGALNRPEISSTINDIQEQVRMIQGQIRETFGIQSRSPSPRESTPVKSPKPAVAYLVHVTFEGVEIFGNSPLKSKKEPLAYILFRLAGVHLRMTNCPETHRQILEYPEVHINLRQIEWEIARISDAGVRTCGRVAFGALVTATSKMADDGTEQRYFDVATDGFEVILSPETVSTAVDVLGYMGDKIKDLDTSRELELLRKLRQTRPKIIVNDEQEEQEEPDFLDSWLSSIRYNFEIRKMQISWLVLRALEEPAQGKEDLVFTWDKIELGTRTRNSARLTVENFQVQTVPTNQDKRLRSANSALLPEVVFNVAYVSTSNARRMAFQAVGKALDLRLTSGFVIPVSNVIDSINLSVKNVRQASQHWNPPRRPSQLATPSDKPTEPRKALFGNKRMESFLVDADFAGAVVYLVGKKEAEDSARTSRATRAGLAGKYGQFSADDNSTSTVMKSPGIAFKVEYRDPGTEDPSLYGEIMIDASSNTLYPSFVPLVMDMTASIKEVVADTSDKPDEQQQTLAKTKTAQEDYLLDPSAVIGRLKLNLGLRICRQEFTLSCQPIARVAATAAFDDVYFTVNTVASADQGKFFAISGAITNLHASVRHVYSREETGQFNVDSIVLSLMNSKHVSGTSGASAILKFSPMEVSVNAKQLQDFLLFREIWIPRDVRQTSTNPMAKLQTETSQGHLVQRYQQVAATAAFPWTATVSMEALIINVDLGQAIGKSKFAITDFWVSSKKTSDWEQNLCLGFQRIGVDSQGRMSGFVAMQDFKLRTVIQWPQREQALNDTPMVQASVRFSKLQVKAAFDYQAFLVADIKSMDFLMYNVRRPQGGAGDRLVATFEGDAVQVFGTTTSAAQGIALYQAFMKLVAERKASFETSLKEIEKFMRRSSTASATTLIQRPSVPKARDDGVLARAPISLDTDVVVTFKALNLGIFPTTFSDHQVFKMEALNAQARFAASIDDRRVHSILGLTLGQLRIGLAGVRTVEAPKALSELAVEDVVQSATGSRGGTILKVPRVEATMQTWQRPDSRHIDYIFKSAFEGKVEVGWNYSRISSIRDMWANHTKTLALAYGREVAITSAIKVTGITAEVDLPQSKYEYNALEPPIIETPQLRDMGEATPPLEWIGLHRDRLPNLTHQIVIVSLLELAGEVEDAYSRILGSS
ncbi:Protein CSF1 [Cytospora mali]|uniref:Protein CSF1 n=1 Tax=Cytospora mali TaxID=578113 RepID=A0A194VV48_CYTMA|nr:Protein CSF1 [Valsa mali]